MIICIIWLSFIPIMITVTYFICSNTFVYLTPIYLTIIIIIIPYYKTCAYIFKRIQFLPITLPQKTPQPLFLTHHCTFTVRFVCLAEAYNPRWQLFQLNENPTINCFGLPQTWPVNSQRATLFQCLLQMHFVIYFKLSYAVGTC